MKKAILAVSFGTTHQDTLGDTISLVEKEMSAAFPEWEVRRAFTSSIVMKRLRDDYKVEVDNVEEALTRLKDDGYDKVVLQPTHIINGEEYEKLCRMAQPFENEFDEMKIGAPLLTSKEDYYKVARGLSDVLPAKADGHAVVLMGHGSEHFANAAYCELEYVFHDIGRNDVFIGTVEGYPSIEQVVSRLNRKRHIQIKDVTLAPLMVVAGDHAKNDMAGNSEASWKCLLEKEGYYVKCIMKGIGEYPEIRALFISHAKGVVDSI